MKVLFTGGGSIATAYLQRYAADVVSLRKQPDAQWYQLLENYDVIIHNAANLDFNQPLTTLIQDNFDITRRLLDTIFQYYPTKHFIYIGSMSYLETATTYITPQKMSNYAFSKYLGEVYCLQHPHLYTSIVRFSTLFYQNPFKDGISKLIYEAATKGSITLIDGGIAVRDILPIDVAVQYLYKLANTTVLASSTLNIASHKATSFAEIANYLLRKDSTLEINNYQSQSIMPSILADFPPQIDNKLDKIDFIIENYISEYFSSLKP